jgi:hypothetical protein
MEGKMLGKHTNDDGDLSLFAGDDEILIACSKGHYWILPAKQHKVPAAGREDSEATANLMKAFGPSPLRSMRREAP